MFPQTYHRCSKAREKREQLVQTNTIAETTEFYGSTL